MGPVTLLLVLANVGVYIAQGVSGVDWFEPRTRDLLAWGGNLALLTFTGEPWRLATSMFLHGGLVHLLMNMYMLCVMGPLTERVLRRDGMLLTYLLGGLAASYASAWWSGSHLAAAFIAGDVSRWMGVSVGASGAIMALVGALLGALGVLALKNPGNSPAAGLRRGLMQVVALNLVAGALIPGVDQTAHLGGLVAGLLIGAAIAWVRHLVPALLVPALPWALPLLLGTLGAGALQLPLQTDAFKSLPGLRQVYDRERGEPDNQDEENAGTTDRRDAAA